MVCPCPSPYTHSDTGFSLPVLRAGLRSHPHARHSHPRRQGCAPCPSLITLHYAVVRPSAIHAVPACSSSVQSRIHTRRAVARRHQIYISRGYAREDSKGRGGGFALSERDWSKRVRLLPPPNRTYELYLLFALISAARMPRRPESQTFFKWFSKIKGKQPIGTNSLGSNRTSGVYLAEFSGSMNEL
jgi:hypothetical protein